MRYLSTTIDSPVGRLTLVGNDDGIAAVLWEGDDPRRVRLATAAEGVTHPVLAEAGRQLAECFAGGRRAFTVPLNLVDTDFQKQVWRALLEIPFGETRTYVGIARRVGRPTASRAVGAANGRNPLSIIVPCHRVVCSSGALTGFAGGLAVKAALLKLEAG